eukprot:COSAG02_NODE_2676_length_8272_cov_7.901994_5_plen_148_part_00
MGDPRIALHLTELAPRLPLSDGSANAWDTSQQLNLYYLHKHYLLLPSLSHFTSSRIDRSLTIPTAGPLGLFVFVLLRSTTLPPSLFSACAVFCEVSSRNRVLFSSRFRVARLASAYDVRCGVTVCDLHLIESCVFWNYRIFSTSRPL